MRIKHCRSRGLDEAFLKHAARPEPVTERGIIMHEQTIRFLLEELRKGNISVEKTLAQLRNLPYEDLGFAKIDHHRPLRKGFPEVVYCPGKTPSQVLTIIEELISYPGNILATRAEEALFNEVKEKFPEARYNPQARTIVIRRDYQLYGYGTILVISAGTSDIPVAEEAFVTCEVMGNKVEKIFDVGVAGIHRLLNHREKIHSARAIICVAGMEGALPSVVGGLAACPIIAVPTSVGYGAHLEGIAPLLTMLNSCASGVSVVNIDNGFGAGYSASLINRAHPCPRCGGEETKS